MAGVLASTTAAVHFLSLLYIGLGGFLGWKWPKSLFVHVFFAAWGFVVILARLPCPLTLVQDHFRHVQGKPSLPGGFNEYYIYGEIIPRESLHVVAVGAIVLLVVSYVGAYLRWRARRATAARETPTESVGSVHRERTARSDRVGRS